MKQKLSKRLLAMLSSRKFFWTVMIFFVFESVWIALSARYPMAFDEDFHFGVIKLYAGNHFSPFFASGPSGGDMFGAIARDPSYLYHYLMSFPYRLVRIFTDSQTIQIVVLRLINVTLFGGGLIAFRALLTRAKLSRMLVHTVLAIFVLVPIVPLLAGQINYDNLLVLTVPLTLLLALSILDGLRRHRIYVAQVLLLISALFLESLIKYPFLAIAAAICGYLAYRLAHTFWGQWSAIPKIIAANYAQISRRAFAGLIILLTISVGLVVQRYGVNVMKYHTPMPDCAVVLTVKQCQSYGPWARNHEYVAQKPYADKNPIAYANLWFHAMLLRSFFAINGPFSDYTNYFPFWLPQATAECMCLASVVLVIFFAKKIFGGRLELQLFAVTLLLYLTVLAYTNYKDYVRIGEPVAINGRYLLLVLPLVMAIAAISFTKLLQNIRAVYLKSWLAIVVILLFLQGGGFVTFILQSDASWYWQDSQPIAHMNSAARAVIRPFIYKKPADRFLKYE